MQATWPAAWKHTQGAVPGGRGSRQRNADRGHPGGGGTALIPGPRTPGVPGQGARAHGRPPRAGQSRRRATDGVGGVSQLRKVKSKTTTSSRPSDNAETRGEGRGDTPSPDPSVRASRVHGPRGSCLLPTAPATLLQAGVPFPEELGGRGQTHSPQERNTRVSAPGQPIRRRPDLRNKNGRRR